MLLLLSISETQKHKAVNTNAPPAATPRKNENDRVFWWKKVSGVKGEGKDSMNGRADEHKGPGVKA